MSILKHLQSKNGYSIKNAKELANFISRQRIANDEPRWWRRYIDDSNTCLQKDDDNPFHKHLNSINPHIQFTLEMLSVSTGHPTIAFLDTNTTVLPCGQVEVSVYRKATHTSKYLSFDSHSPAQSKTAVVKTLMDRARCLPSSNKQRRTAMVQSYHPVISGVVVKGSFMLHRPFFFSVCSLPPAYYFNYCLKNVANTITYSFHGQLPRGVCQ